MKPEHGKEVVSCGRIPENTNLQIVNDSEPAEEEADRSSTCKLNVLLPTR